MALCVTVDSSSNLVATTTPLADCISYVIQTSSEYNANQPTLSQTDASTLVTAVISVWILAYCFKLLFKVLPI